MKRFISFFLFTTTPLVAAMPTAGPNLAQGPNLFEKEPNLVINNRVLLKVNGKPITVMDVVRKMDLIFYRQFPELAASPMARYQFYLNSWQAMLGAVIDDHLIVADAEEKKVEITEGEVREELESLFGPDVVFNLDKMGLTLNEAMDMLKRELTVQRMNMMMVRSKAMAETQPKEVRARYERMVDENPPQCAWVYRVLSIRGDGHERVAQEASKLLNEQKLPFEEVVTKLSNQDVELALSSEYEIDEKSISLGHKALLQTLSAGASSTPQTKDSVSRIFCLKEYKKAEPIPFNSISEKIKSEIIREISAKYDEEYRQKLRKQYGMTDRYLKRMIPENFEPFALR
ncbi:MAG: hypothetical protein JJU12_04465 [Chlamydiales bacterium]|nr:hypothetical protein [Chlamydiales bacterium]